MSAREQILAAIRNNQPAATDLPDVPLFDTGLPPLWEWFKASLARMGGRLSEPAAGADLTALVHDLFPDAKVICSATPEVTGTRTTAEVARPRDLDDVDVGVARAKFGVAETGSVFLSEAELGVNALGFLAQHLVVLLDPAELTGNLHQAYQRPEFAQADYGLLMTGPSATADIEGVLIHGAQGVRTLTIVATPRPQPA